MDVIGRAPTSKRGKYFGNNNIWWHPLASYCKEVAPGIASGCRHWYSNDGDGLDAAASRALAEALKAEIESGRCADIERQAEAARIDDGSGMPCLVCDGCGFHRPSFTTPFSVENVRDFAAFLRDCGGFAIW
jgi:hypothetical protein